MSIMFTSFKPLPIIVLISVFAGTATFSLIALALSGALCDATGYGYCYYGGTVTAGPVIGIIAALFSMIFCGLALCFLLIPFLSKFSFIRLILFFGFCGVFLFSFISAVILAYTATNLAVGFHASSHGTCGAASAFQFFVMLSVVAAGYCVLTIQPRGDAPPANPSPSAPPA